MINLDIFIFLAIGSLAGFFAGLLGIGGGIITVPLLLLYFDSFEFPADIKMQLAIGTSLATMVITTLSSGWAHYRKRAVDFSFVCYLGLGNFVGAICGAYLTGIFPSQSLQVAFGLFEAIVGVTLLFPQRKRAEHKKAPPMWILSAAGCGIATFATLLGIGGGLLQVPLLTYFHLPLKKAIGTASILSFVIALTASLSFIFFERNLAAISHSAGFIYLPAWIGLGIASILAAPWGVKLVHKCPTQVIRKGFAVILLIAGFVIILTAH